MEARLGEVEEMDQVFLLFYLRFEGSSYCTIGSLLARALILEKSFGPTLKRERERERRVGSFSYRPSQAGSKKLYFHAYYYLYPLRARKKTMLIFDLHIL